MDKKPIVYNPFTAEKTIEEQKLRIITLEGTNKTLMFLLEELKKEMESMEGKNKMNKNKYRVRIGYYDFGFSNGSTAMSFAELAQSNFIPGKIEDELSISITINSEFCEEDENNENDK